MGEVLMCLLPTPLIDYLKKVLQFCKALLLGFSVLFSIQWVFWVFFQKWNATLSGSVLDCSIFYSLSHQLSSSVACSVWCGITAMNSGTCCDTCSGSWLKRSDNPTTHWWAKRFPLRNVFYCFCLLDYHTSARLQWHSLLHRYGCSLI